MYGTYKLVQAMPGGEFLTGFTRIMHRTKDDEVMGEVSAHFFFVNLNVVNSSLCFNRPLSLSVRI